MRKYHEDILLSSDSCSDNPRSDKINRRDSKRQQSTSLSECPPEVNVS
jgi:hypothetical protein